MRVNSTTNIFIKICYYTTIDVYSLNWWKVIKGVEMSSKALQYLLYEWPLLGNL